MAKILIINQNAPYNGIIAQEVLDIAIAAANFEHEVDILFINHGIFQLNNNQNPIDINLKNYTKTFAALTLYGINNIYNAASMNDSAITDLFNNSDIIL